MNKIIDWVGVAVMGIVFGLMFAYGLLGGF